jgi:hypothetical protein
MNTSEPAYQDATGAIKSLSASYVTLASEYRGIIEHYDSLVSSFDQTVRQYEASNNVTLIQSYPDQVRPIPTSLLTVSVLIERGDGTKTWYNNTQVQAGWSMYITTVALLNGSVSATWYPQYGEHLINGLAGVPNTTTRSWFLWTHNGTVSWELAQLGSDLTPATNGSSFAWTYCQFNGSYLPTCTP